MTELIDFGTNCYREFFFSIVLDCTQSVSPKTESNYFDSSSSIGSVQPDAHFIKFDVLNRQNCNPFQFTLFSRCRNIIPNIEINPSCHTMGVGWEDWRRIYFKIYREKTREIFSPANPINVIPYGKSTNESGEKWHKIEKRFEWFDGIRFMLRPYIPCNISPFGYGVKVKCKNR